MGPRIRNWTTASLCALAFLCTIDHPHGRQYGCSGLPGLIPTALQGRADSLFLVLTWKVWRKVWLVWLGSGVWLILNAVTWCMHGTWESIPIYLLCSKMKKLSSLFLLFGVKYVYKTTLDLKYRETGEEQLRCYWKTIKV